MIFIYNVMIAESKQKKLIMKMLLLNCGTEGAEGMRTYTVTEYEKSDYDDYENNITIGEIISNLGHIRRGYVGDYNYTGEEDDFDRFKLHMAVFKAIELLNEIKEEAERKLKEE